MKSTLAFCFALASLAAAPSARAQTPTGCARRWAIAVVLESDGGLEEDLADDLNELTNILPNGSPPASITCSDLVVQFRNSRGEIERRHRDWTKFPPVEIPVNSRLDQEKLNEYWPSVLTGRPAPLAEPGALAAFIVEVAADYRPNRIALFIGSHGEATKGPAVSSEPGSGSAGSQGSGTAVAEDGVRALGSNARPLLNRRFGDELKRAAEQLSRAAETPETRTQVAFVGLDACQLAAVEVQYEIGTFLPGAVSVASQENQGGPGWSYAALFREWSNPADGKALASMVMKHIDTAWSAWSNSKRDLGSLSQLDPSAIAAAAPDLDAVGSALIQEASVAGLDCPVLKSVEAARSSCRRFPGASHANAQLVDALCFADVLAQNVAVGSRITGLASVARAKIMAGIADNACFRDRQPNPRCGRGLSVYLPPAGSALSPAYDATAKDPRPRFIDAQGTGAPVGGWAEWVRFWNGRRDRLKDCN